MVSTVLSTAEGYQACLAPVAEWLPKVKESLLAIVPPETQMLAGTVNASLTSGGKYLRPAVALLMGMAADPSYDLYQNNTSSDVQAVPKTMNALVEVAAVSEMIHIATLLHDDVLDEAALRRGKQTVRAALGNKISVLSGDYLLAQASLKLANLGNARLVSIYAQVLADLCDGEVEQMTRSYLLQDDLAAAWESYTRKTFCKTASLFAAGCEAAGVVNGLAEPEIQTLRRYGREFGLAFQIVDDLLDYTSSEAEMGKPVLDDLRNGLLNAPVLLAFESEALSEAERDIFKALIQQVFKARLDGGHAAPDDWQQAVLDTLQRARAFEKTGERIQWHVQQAVDTLLALPDSPAKQALIDIAQGVADRRS